MINRGQHMTSLRVIVISIMNRHSIAARIDRMTILMRIGMHTTTICSIEWTESTSRILGGIRFRWRESRWGRCGESTIATYFGSSTSPAHAMPPLSNYFSWLVCSSHFSSFWAAYTSACSNTTRCAANNTVTNMYLTLTNKRMISFIEELIISTYKQWKHKLKAKLSSFMGRDMALSSILRHRICQTSRVCSCRWGISMSRGKRSRLCLKVCRLRSLWDLRRRLRLIWLLMISIRRRAWQAVRRTISSKSSAAKDIPNSPL